MSPSFSIISKNSSPDLLNFIILPVRVISKISASKTKILFNFVVGI
jgi:hypothetical protein